ncbi:hypothetical protein C8R48DRAFT_778243 [Suillus tomentosus]|nr:hypothetical protein C8R48DRAFT_778243 [Suillus tomentosus]
MLKKSTGRPLLRGHRPHRSPLLRLARLLAHSTSLFEYADMLSTQGLVKEAVAFLKLMPADYIGSALNCAGIRERLLIASGEHKVTPAAPAAGTSRAAIQSDLTSTIPPASFGYASYPPPVPAQTYAPVQSISQPSYNPYAVPAAARPIHPTSVPQSGQHQHLPPSCGPIPSAPPKCMPNGGWNDAPVVTNNRRASSSLNLQKPLAIVSPFSNAPSPRIVSPPALGSPHAGGHGQNAPLPPPPRPTSVQSRVAQWMMHPPPPSGPPAHPQGMQPPSNWLMSPTQQHAPLPSVPGPYSPSMQTAQLQPPGPYAHATPPPGPLRGPGQPLGPPGPYAAPPPGQAGPLAPPSGPYALSSSQAQQPPPGPYALPPGQVQQQQPRGIPQGPLRVPPAPHPLASLPPQQGPPGVASARGASNTQPPCSRQGPPPPKYPPGDHSNPKDQSRARLIRTRAHLGAPYLRTCYARFARLLLGLRAIDLSFNTQGALSHRAAHLAHRVSLHFYFEELLSVVVLWVESLSRIPIPHLQLEPTTRDTSEIEGRRLRPNSRRIAREEAIAAFDRAVESIVPGPLFIQHTRGRSHNISEPPRPDPALFARAPRQLISPVTPSPEESIKEESSDGFEAIDNPRSQLPGAFLHTPNQPPFNTSNLSALSTLTELDNSSDTPPNAPVVPARENVLPTTGIPKIKQEALETPRAPFSIPGGTVITNLPFAYTCQAPVSHKIPAPAISQPPVMSTVRTRMPVRGTTDAPKFDGTTDNLADFIDLYEQLVDDVGLQGLDRIKGIIRYLERNDRELWGRMPEVQVSDYNAFMKEVKVMYPRWDGKRRYTLLDLQAIAHEYANKTMPSYQELSNYLRAFKKVMQPLLAEDRIGKAERNRIFMEGIPKDTQALIRTRLMIKFPDHYPQDPYPFMDVFTAGHFVLPANAPAASATPSAPTAVSFTNLVTATTSAQLPAQGMVTKREYKRDAPTFNDCAFCGSLEHYYPRCVEKQRYIDVGKCKVSKETRKLVLPNGDWIPGRGLLKERLDRHHTSRTTPDTTASTGVTAGLFYRASDEIDAVIEVGSSAFVHTVAQTELDEDDETVDLMTEAIAYVAARRDQKRNAKGKNVCFDGVEIPSETRVRPRPASRQATVEEEIISPEIRASSDKGKEKEVAKVAPLSAPISAPTSAKAPPKGASPSSSTPSSSTPVSSSSSSPSQSSALPPSSSSTPTQAPAQSSSYRYAFALEDKEADKHVVERLLDSNLNIPVRELLAVSPDVRQHFHELTTKKCITVGAVSDVRMRSDDGKIVADHFAPLRCIRAKTLEGRTLTCILDQGAEVVVMPREVWKELSIPLRSDHSLNMESVNTSHDTTLGVIENVPLDFGAGPLYFQVQVIERATFEVLLGRPFFKLTSCRTFDLPDGEQDLILTDPNACKELRIPTLPWVKRQLARDAKCASHAHSHALKEEEQGF